MPKDSDFYLITGFEQGDQPESNSGTHPESSCSSAGSLVFIHGHPVQRETGRFDYSVTTRQFTVEGDRSSLRESFFRNCPAMLQLISKKFVSGALTDGLLCIFASDTKVVLTEGKIIYDIRYRESRSVDVFTIINTAIPERVIIYFD